jgi:hypothetical protein
MAQIDPELQKKMNLALASFSDACKRMRDKTTEMGLAMIDMAIELRSDESTNAAEEAKKLLIWHEDDA